MHPSTKTSNHQWSCVQGNNGHVSVTQKTGSFPPISNDQARIRIVSSSICGADLRIVNGDKDTHAQNTGVPVILGHECCGVIDDIAYPTADLRIGDFVIVLPHIHASPEQTGGCTRDTQSILASCTSRKHTHHAGWDFDGGFTDVGIFPTANLVPVPTEHLRRAEQLAPGLGRALFTITEPMLCCLSAYQLMEREGRDLFAHEFTPGRALVIGCGPIGIMHSIILSEKGYDVWFSDPVCERSHLAQSCLGGGHVLDTAHNPGNFDVVMVTANVVNAVRQGEFFVKDGGILYLFAGMNASDRKAVHAEAGFSYEGIHRAARGVLTMTQGKRVLYLGHSGYSAHLVHKAIATVSANADRLSKIVTGLIQGWSSPTIQTRLDEIAAWHTSDDSPAIIAVLKGKADLRQHGKLIVLTQESTF